MFHNLKKGDELIVREIIGHSSCRKYGKVIVKSVSAGGKISVEQYGEIYKFDVEGNHKNRPDYSTHYYTLLPDNETTTKEIADYELEQQHRKNIFYLENFHGWSYLDKEFIATLAAELKIQKEKHTSH